MGNIKVGVLVISYNHEPYIEQCLNSIFVQKTEDLLSLEVIIVDDSSSDNSSEIFNRHKDASGIPFRMLESTSRGGARHNVMKLLSVTGYDYLAFIDGDDYWSDENKLLQQIKFLEQHKDYIGSCHDATIRHEDEEAKKALFAQFRSYSQAFFYSHDIFPWDVLGRDIIPTSSLVIRQESLRKIRTDWIVDDFSLDWKMTLFVVKDSKMRYFNEPWSVYRNHSKGFSKSHNQGRHQSHILFLKKLMTDDKYCYLKLHIYKALVREYAVLIPQLVASNKRIPLRESIDYLLCELKRVGLNFMDLTKSR
jgi:glycosyltransferase involved in cell wall biosynthesis